jgi:U3 small nucleolar RNA-associated protein 10
MNEDQLRPLIVKQTKWAFKSKNTEGESFPYNLHKSISFLRSMNALLNGLREFFVPLMPLYFDRVISIISILGQQKEQENLKRKRQQIDFNADDKHCHTFYELLTLTIKNMQLNFVFDNVSFIQNDTFEKISEPIAQLVTLTQIGSEYNNFLEDVLKPGVFDIVERINNDDMWKKINYDILMHTRNASAQVRLGAFKIIEYLFNRIGERYLILLNDTIPFLSEGMEDENPDVETCAKAIVARIEQMTGDSIHEYLK